MSLLTPPSSNGDVGDEDIQDLKNASAKTTVGADIDLEQTGAGAEINGTGKNGSTGKPTRSKKEQQQTDSDSDSSSDEEDVPLDDESSRTKEQLLALKGKAPNRIRQFGQYLRLMEARMASLEAELSELKKGTGDATEKKEEDEEEEKEESEKDKDKEKSKDPICEIKAGDSEFFDRIVEDDQSPSDDIHARLNAILRKKTSDQKWVIEVLVSMGKTAVAAQTTTNTEPSTKLERRGTTLAQNDNSPPAKIQYPERIRIRSRPLLECLGQLATNNSDGFTADTLIFMAPFKFFVKNEEKIRARLQDLEEATKSDTPDTPGVELDEKQSKQKAKEKQKKKKETEKLISHLRLLVSLLDGLLQPTLQVYRSLTAKTATHISFEHLYYLFDYGQDVFSAGSNGNNQLYRVYGFTGGRNVLVPRDGDDDWQPGFTVDCYNVASNGQSYGPIPRQFTITRFYGQREIASLPVFPLEFHPKVDEVRKQAAERGEVYIELSNQDKVIHRDYRGVTLDDPPEEIESQVIVDQLMAIRYNEDYKSEFGVRAMTSYNDRELAAKCTCSPGCSFAVYRDFHQDLEDDKQTALEYFSTHKHTLQPSDDSKLPHEEDRILLPDHVYGFVLRSRKWAKLKLDTIKPIEYKNSFDRLVLPRGHAESVRALVLNHSGGPKADKGEKQIEIAMDLVRGKGKGLIILLHGEPGVGKTSTAECIADYTKRPLYPITCGDIGSQAEKVEANLERTFQLAHKWGCVLLLDEADVFLQERTREDIERNAIVSVFLRNMEYYSGILFLTTNRVGTLDQAFRSRIHLSLYYPALDEEATMKIWKMHIDTAKQLFRESDRDIVIDRDDILAFAKEHYREMKDTNSGTWNGRQIRNAFQTAIALAEMDATIAGGKPHLQGKQFEVVAKTSSDFDEYLRSAQGGTSARLAKLHKIRNDDFKSKAEKERSYKKASAAKARSTKKSRRAKEESSSSSSESDSDDSSDSSSSEEEVKKSKKKGRASVKEKTKKAKAESSEDESSSPEEVVKEKKEKKEKKKSSKKRDNA